MTATLTRATHTRTRTTRQDFRRHLLALVLVAVLLWYTVVSPSYTAAPLRASDGEPPDAQEREVETQAARGFAGPLNVAHRPDAFGIIDEEDELDWPEIIGDD